MSSKSAKAKQAADIKAFCDVTAASSATAKQVLERTQYNLDEALDHYYTHRDNYPAAKAVKAGDTKKLTAIFNKFAGTEEDDKDVIFGEKLGDFFRAIEVDPEGDALLTLQLAWELKCATMGEIGREEFMALYQQRGIDTTAKMAEHARQLKKRAEAKAAFKDFYRWLFGFAIDGDKRKTIDTDQAVSLWGIVLVGQLAMIDDWLVFVSKQQGMKAVGRDLWDQLLEFATEIKPDLSNWSDDGAWPVAIDDFVEYLQEKRAK